MWSFLRTMKWNSYLTLGLTKADFIFFYTKWRRTVTHLKSLNSLLRTCCSDMQCRFSVNVIVHTFLLGDVLGRNRGDTGCYWTNPVPESDGAFVPTDI